MGVIGVTRDSHPIVTLLALALLLGAGFLPAAAQSGSEAVVCVGSEGEPWRPTRSAGSTRRTWRSCTGSGRTSAGATRSSAISARSSAPIRRCGARGPIPGTIMP